VVAANGQCPALLALDIISVRRRRPRYADRWRPYRVRNQRRRLRLAPIFRYWANSADRRLIREISRVCECVRRTSRLDSRTDAYWYVRVCSWRCHLSAQTSLPLVCRRHAAVRFAKSNWLWQLFEHRELCKRRVTMFFLLLLSYSVFDLIFSLFFVSGPCAKLSWPSRQLLSAR